MKKTYHLPVKIEVDGPNPDRVAAMIAQRIYSAVRLMLDVEYFAGTAVDVEYSIYEKADGKKLARKLGERKKKESGSAAGGDAVRDGRPDWPGEGGPRETGGTSGETG
jgi:hypothetical protein